MLSSVGTCPSQADTLGASDEAVFVDRTYLSERDRTLQSLAVGMPLDVIDELHTVAKEASTPGWDGGNALPVLAQTAQRAEEILKDMPLMTEAPSIGVEPDGCLTLEWYRSPKRVLSVSVGPEAELHFAALIGSSTIYGSDFFIGEGRTRILALIGRIVRG